MSSNPSSYSAPSVLRITHYSHVPPASVIFRLAHGNDDIEGSRVREELFGGRGRTGPDVNGGCRVWGDTGWCDGSGRGDGGRGCAVLTASPQDEVLSKNNSANMQNDGENRRLL